MLQTIFSVLLCCKVIISVLCVFVHPHACEYHNTTFICSPAADSGGGDKGGHAPLSLLKLVIKKMAATGGPLYFIFLAPPPLTILDPIL